MLEIIGSVLARAAGILAGQISYGMTPPRQQVDVSHPEPLPLRSRRPEGARLEDAISRILDHHGEIRQRASDLFVELDQDQRFYLSEPELARIIFDVLELAFEHANVRRVFIYAARQPSCERISVAAEYALEEAPPRLRIVGQNDAQCNLVPTSDWPRGCTATWFDNGFEYIYQVAISKA